MELSLEQAVSNEEGMKGRVEPGEASERPEHSIKMRYLFKLATNLAGLLMGFAVMGMAPRALGPAAYGNFNFLTEFFNKLFGFFDMGTSTCFYTKLSQRNFDRMLIPFYLGFAGVVIMLVFLTVGALFAGGMEKNLWPDQQMLFVWAACLWGALTWLSQIVNKITDAYSLTVSSELVRLAQKVFSTLIIMILFFQGWINLHTFFLYNYVLFIFVIVGWWLVLGKRNISLLGDRMLRKTEITTYSREFYHYSHPLLTTSLMALIIGFGDRWLLQKFAGSVEQGFYSLSNQVGMVCMLFTSAMTPLLLREFSVAYEQRDKNKMVRLFSRYVPMLYSMAAYFSVFLALQAREVSLILGGKEYMGATQALAVMVLYPIHQTYGQLSNSVLLAVDRTRIYRNIAVFMSVVGTVATYFLIAPVQWFGMNLGAMGLAIKMVVINFISVNIFLWVNTKMLDLSFARFLWHQVYSVALMAVAALLAIKVVGLLTQQLITSFLLTGMLYTLLVIVCGYLFPAIFSVSRREIHEHLASFKTRITRS